MKRTFAAALLAVCGLSSTAPAQTFYYGPTGYTNYSYVSGYGPLSAFDSRWWTGTPYSSPFYGSTAFTASYSPVVTTSYFSPVMDTSAAAFYSPTIVASNSCCTPCCSPCGSCASCASGNCPGGNCALNYAPSGELKPEPDPNSGGSSGSKTFESQSNGASGTPSNGTGGATPADPAEDDFGPYNRDRSDDGFGASGERGAGYRPQTKIEQKAPMDAVEEEAEAGSSAASGATPPADATPMNGAGGASEAGGLNAPPAEVPADGDPDASVLPALNLDSKITAAPSLLRERVRMKARFGSPRLARAKVDPSALPAAEVRLVQK